MSGERSLRVVFLGHSAAPSGAELGLIEVIGALSDVLPHVILAEDGPIVDRMRARGIPVDVVPLGDGTRTVRRHELRRGSFRIVAAGVASAGYGRRLARRVRALDADLVEANTLKAFLYGAVAARLAATPLVWHVHDRISADYLPRPAIGLLRGAAHVAASGVIANSESTLSTLGRLRAPSAVVHEPISSDAFTGRRRRSGGPFTVAMLGRIAPWKGQDVFLEAFHRAFAEGDERARIVGGALFGEDDFRRSLERRVGELGLAGRVELCGFRDDVSAELARVDALVHASVVPEPFGRVVVEGMAAGLPVIAANAGGPAEIVTDGVDGLLHRAGDVDSLAAALRRVATEPALAERLGAAGRARAAAFSPENAARATAAFYRRVLDESSRAVAA